MTAARRIDETKLRRVLAPALAALLLSGCMASAPCDWHREADLVAAAWESHYADLTDEQYECVHHFEPIRIDRDSRRCDSTSSGCTVVNLLTGHVRVYIRSGLSERVATLTMRHEATHVLLRCVTGKVDVYHQHPAFAGSGVVDTPGSLGVLADGEDVGYECGGGT